MKILISLLACLGFAACTINSDGGGGGGSDDCIGDHCVCPSDESCEHACADGNAECHVQAQPGLAVDVQCNNNLECHVECSASSSCQVDCGGSTDCHVTCPASGCTVTDCIGPDCVVSCGALGVATHNGSTATCP